MITEDMINPLELLGENEYLRKEIERLNNIIDKAKKRCYELQVKYKYILDDVIFTLEKANLDKLEELKEKE